MRLCMIFKYTEIVCRKTYSQKHIWIPTLTLVPNRKQVMDNWQNGSTMDLFDELCTMFKKMYITSKTKQHVTSFHVSPIENNTSVLISAAA